MLTRGPSARNRRLFHLPHLRHPAQVIVLSFLVALAAGTALLMLPASVTEAPPAGPLPAPVSPAGGAPPVEAVFTAASAVFVTGLVVVDTATYWSGFGQLVILGLIQVGGLGIMTFASLLGLLTARRLGFRTRMVTGASLGTLSLGDLRAVLLGVARTALAIETVVAAVVAGRLVVAYDYTPGRALWHGVFHAVSAFNNAGFALYTDNLMRFATDPWVCLPVAAAVILGGLGFPVVLELVRSYRFPARWSLTAKVVLAGTAVLLVVSTTTVLALEWSNPGTLGPLDTPGKLLAGFFTAVAARTAGFNTLDVAAMHTQTWFAHDVFMFIGAGPAGTAGGLKITTFSVLLFIIVTEIRGGTAVNMFGRRLPRSLHREATTIALLAVAVVMTGTWILLITTPFSLDQALFEVISAFATVGLSTGITHLLPDAGQLMLVVIMFAGRVGPITVASALALRTRALLYELPKERPLIG
ncbi:potassium transporter TrkG [Georgenia sp. EYE_87]|uniref:TrkH family potassium uptake protein n=1 Tax=Georgenia sp. EYE_87 TaxID=2853448 RepID=UPI00200339D0|nr:potassium transporter TrkG [Georgenia sp. EYE_87]